MIPLSDHFDAPDLKSPNMDARVDICDIFAFRKPGDTGKTVLAFNVNPLAPTMDDSFDPEAVYEIKLDTDGDAVADIAYRCTFSPKENGAQRATLRRATGDLAKGNGKDGDILFQDLPVSFGEKANVARSGEYLFFAGIRSDPFFFDLDGYKNGMKFTGADFFADKNVFSIILELPNSALGPNPRVGCWTRVLIPKDGNPFFQIDRMGHPFMNVGFTLNEDKDTFNRIEPTQDREMFMGKLTDLLASHGRSLEDAQRVAFTLLPDILDYDYSRPSGYPNGRTLTDDIIDFQLAVLTNGLVTSDKAGPHGDLLSTFPYLGVPHPLSAEPKGVPMPAAGSR